LLCSMPNNQYQPFCSSACFDARTTTTTNTNTNTNHQETATPTVSTEIEETIEAEAPQIGMKEMEQLDLSVVSDDVIDYMIIPLMDAKVFHYLKCTNKAWYQKLSARLMSDLPKFRMIKQITSNYVLEPNYMTVSRDSKVYISRNGYNAFTIDLDSKTKTEVLVWKDETSVMPIHCGFSVGGILFNSKNQMVVAAGSLPVVFTYSPEKKPVNWVYLVDDYFDRMLVAYNRATLGPQEVQAVENWTTEADYYIEVSDDEQTFTITSEQADRGRDISNCVYPLFVTTGLEDDILVIDSERRYVQVFDERGKWKRSIGAYPNVKGTLDDAISIAVSKVDGRIFVADGGMAYDTAADQRSPSVYVYNYDGVCLFNIGLKKGGNERYFSELCSIALSNCGRYLFAIDSEKREIQVFNAMNGELLLTFKGNRTFEGESQEGRDIHMNQKRLGIPTAISVHPVTGHIYVTTEENRMRSDQGRLTVFE
jgi:DNA-binding beta-propeller fold protein YncE